MDQRLADEVASKLDLDLDATPICLVCLSFVSMAIDRGVEAEIRRETARMAPDLWAEGLELPARLALERAQERGVKSAEAALADVEARGGRSVVAKAIVRRLARQLSEQARALAAASLN